RSAGGTCAIRRTAAPRHSGADSAKRCEPRHREPRRRSDGWVRSQPARACGRPAPPGAPPPRVGTHPPPSTVDPTARELANPPPACASFPGFRPQPAGGGGGMPPAGRNAALLSGGLVCLSGMIQLAVALGTVTIVAVTGVSAILGLGPAVFLVAGALAVGPAGRLSDR